MIACIVCLSHNGVIGKDHKMPWHSVEELAYFKKQTIGQQLLMGRITYENLPKPLENRSIHVLSRSKDVKTKEKITLWHDYHDVLKRWMDSKDVLFICGGASIYELFLPYAKVLYISILKKQYDGDCYFPKWDQKQFTCVSKTSFYDFDAYIWERNSLKKEETKCVL